MSIPSASVRITPETAPNWTQRFSSSGLSRFSNRAKKPPMSEPQRLMPESPMLSAWRSEERRPSNPQAVVGSPPQTTWAQGAAPVQPERWKRMIGRAAEAATRLAAQWYWRG